eukprot:TRINITY_DN13296_c0_g1_i1.p2 TRINITY_DN13296_c0_g1~~TRINITY_DN13296_c0_g1_i1.p2  ORF type:complete len:1447 (+),score=259.78 TRINITY_DN13296_c0_g1_i1:79-4419(+)
MYTYGSTSLVIVSTSMATEHVVSVHDLFECQQLIRHKREKRLVMPGYPPTWFVYEGKTRNLKVIAPITEAVFQYKAAADTGKMFTVGCDIIDSQTIVLADNLRFFISEFMKKQYFVATVIARCEKPRFDVVPIVGRPRVDVDLMQVDSPTAGTAKRTKKSAPAAASKPKKPAARKPAAKKQSPVAGPADDNGDKVATVKKVREGAGGTLAQYGASAGSTISGIPGNAHSDGVMILVDGDIPSTAQDIEGGHPNHYRIGQTCSHEFKVGNICSCPSVRLKLLEATTWIKVAKKESRVNDATAMTELIEANKWCTWQDLLRLQGKHTLVLRKELFNVMTAIATAADYIGPVVDLRDGHVEMQTLQERVYVPDDMQLFVLDQNIAILAETSATDPINTKELALQVSIDAALAFYNSDEQRAKHNMSDDDIADSARMIHHEISDFKPGALRSMFQKMIRYFSEYTELLNGNVVRTPIATAVTASLLFASAGSFLPDLQMFSRGCTSAFKRLGVILVEDAFIAQGNQNRIVKWLAAAYLSKEEKTWHPSASLVQSCLQDFCAAADSKVAISLQNIKDYSLSIPVSTLVQTPTVVEARSAHADLLQLTMKNAALFLRRCRSFQGDMCMLEQVANAKITWIVAKTIHKNMRIYHPVDQHNYRGVGHVWTMMSGEPFPNRFRTFFDKNTKYNPRRWPENFKANKQWCRENMIGPTQKLVYRMTHQSTLNYRTELPADDEQEQEFTARYPVGALAAAIGAVKVEKTKLLVCIGTRVPEEEVVIREPTAIRANSSEPLDKVPDDEKRKAILWFRGAGPYKIKNEPLNLGFQFAKFIDGFWCVSKRPDSGYKTWASCLERVHTCAAHPPYELTMAFDDGVVAYENYGTGIRLNGMKSIRALCKQVLADKDGVHVLFRALEATNQQYDSVSLPTPPLTGSAPASDQLAVYDYDDKVYWFLLRCSIFMPGALRCRAPPKFSVPDPFLLQQLVKLIYKEVAKTSAFLDVDAASKLWPALVKGHGRTLYAAQESAVADLESREVNDSKYKHYVLMDTGTGKSTVAATLIRKSLFRGAMTKYVVWVCPSGAITKSAQDGGSPTIRPEQSLEGEIQKLGFRVNTIRSAAEAQKTPLLPGYVNLVNQDVLRVKVNDWLKFMPETTLILDEADQMYNETKRTSAAMVLANSCVRMIAMTATGLRSKDPTGLLRFLKLIVDFPVHKDNWLVGATCLVAKDLVLPLKRHHETVAIPFSVPNTAAYLNLVKQRPTNWWGNAEKMIRSATNPRFVELGVRLNREHGRVMAVANDVAHANELIELFQQKGIAAGDLSTINNPQIQIVVVTKKQSRGYDAIQGYVMMTMVYSGNAADRQQILGRLARIGQVSKDVYYYTMYMQATVAEFLHEHQQNADAANLSLTQLAQKFKHESYERMIQDQQRAAREFASAYHNVDEDEVESDDNMEED